MNRFYACSLVILLLTIGCQTAPKSQSGRTELVANSADTLKQMEATDNSLDAFMATAYGYAIFPKSAKAGSSPAARTAAASSTRRTR